MNPGMGAWAVRASMEPAANLAAMLVERLDIRPPFNIDEIVNEYADVFEENWPYHGCDAVVVGLFTSRPTIYLRSGLSTRRRLFTLAHELGHIQMWWHVGDLGCQPNSGQFDVEPLGEAINTEAVTSPRRIQEQEAEATRFASYFLIPDRFVYPLMTSMDMPHLLAGLGRTNVSAIAILMRLRHLLQPGFCFALKDGTEHSIFTSSGTQLPPMPQGTNLQTIAQVAEDHGVATLSGRQITWFRLSRFDKFESTSDPRSATELLRSAIQTECGDNASQIKMFQSINGVVGGSLSKERAETLEQALAILRHKFASKPEYGNIVNHPDFNRYLRKKVEEWAKRRGIL